MDSTNLDWIEPSLTKFVARFESCFRSEPSRGHLANYLRGQASQLQRKSIEPMALDGGLKPRTLQQFISSYVWDQEAMRCGVRHIVATEHADPNARSEEHTSELQSQSNLVCRLLLEKKTYSDPPIAGLAPRA